MALTNKELPFDPRRNFFLPNSGPLIGQNFFHKKFRPNPGPKSWPIFGWNYGAILGPTFYT